MKSIPPRLTLALLAPAREGRTPCAWGAGGHWSAATARRMLDVVVDSTSVRPASIELRDGRRLSYAEWGDPEGFPILHCHGVPGSRLEHEADAHVYTSLGVRVITPDRPGYGLSDRLPGRTPADWAQDVAELADQLALTRFGMTALSGGGAFALSCAAMIPERITRVVTTSSVAPFWVPGLDTGVAVRLRVGLRLAALAPWLFGAVADGMAIAVRLAPEFFVDHTNRDNAVDFWWLSSAPVRAAAAETVREAFRAGGRGYADDVIALGGDWGFAIDKITVPVEIWHGGGDRVIPVTHARYLASVIPTASLTIVPGEGHMLMWNHLPTILRAVSESRPKAAGRPREVSSHARVAAGRPSESSSC